MTNKEIKLELAKAALSSMNGVDSATLSESVKNLYDWIQETEEDELLPDESTEGNDVRAKPIHEIVNYIDKNWRNGYGSHLYKVFSGSNINNVGELLKIGRRNFMRYRNVGRGSISRIDEALLELYNIQSW